LTHFDECGGEQNTWVSQKELSLKMGGTGLTKEEFNIPRKLRKVRGKIIRSQHNKGGGGEICTLPCLTEGGLSQTGFDSPGEHMKDKKTS